MPVNYCYYYIELKKFEQEWKRVYGGDLPDHVADQWTLVSAVVKKRFAANPTANFEHVRQAIENIILSTTKNIIVQQTGLVIDGLLGGGGQGSIYYCIRELDIMIAKIGPEKLIKHEKKVSDTIKAAAPWCVTILFAIEEHYVSTNRWAMVLPLLSFTLEKLPQSYVDRLNFILIRTTVCILSALKALTIAGYTHNDVKPANIGLQSNDHSRDR